LFEPFQWARNDEISRLANAVPTINSGRYEEIRRKGPGPDGLRQGENLLLYPAGRIYRSRWEELGGNSGVEQILERVPDARVVLVRTRGLWGSGFSFAGSRIGIVAALGLVGLLGLFVVLVFLSLLFTGTLSGLEPRDGNGGVYLETFAVWLVLFLALSIAAASTFPSEAVVPIGFISLGGSLLAISWPIFRGVPWQQVREDLGWTRGRGLLRELFFGLCGYAMAIPLVILSVILISIGVGLVGGGGEDGGVPVHPAVDQLAQASWWQFAQLLVLACVIAPIVLLTK